MEAFPKNPARTVFRIYLFGLAVAFFTLLASLTGSSIAIPAGILTVLLILWGPVTGAIWGTASGLRKYYAWKRTLTPGERMAVNVAEAAAAVALYEHNHRPEANAARAARKQALLDNIVHGTPLR